MKKVTYGQFVKLALDNYDKGGKYALMFLCRTPNYWEGCCSEPRGWTERRAFDCFKTYKYLERTEPLDPDCTSPITDDFLIALGKRYKSEATFKAKFKRELTRLTKEVGYEGK